MGIIKVRLNQVLPSHYLSTMAAGSVVENSPRLLLPNPSFSSNFDKRVANYLASKRATLWPWRNLCCSYSPENNARRSSSSKSVALTRGGRLCVTACYSAVPAPSEIQNSTAKATGLTPSPVSAATGSSSEFTEEAQSNLGGVEDSNLPGMMDSYSTLEGLEYQANSLDPELQGILANIADVQKQNEMLGEQMREIQDLLGKTTRSLNAKAQEAKIEAAKLKKLAKLHEFEAIRRAENVRKKVFEAKLQLERNDRINSSRVTDIGGSTEMLSWKDPTTTSDGENHLLLPSGNGDQPLLEEINGIEQQLPSKLDALPDAPADEPELSVRQSNLNKVESDQNSEKSPFLEETKEEELWPDAITSETQECIVAHPGALSCTKTVIKSDPSRKKAVILMETTVRCDGDACMVTSLDEDDYVALAVRTLAETAEELKKSRFQKARDPDPARHKKHAMILDLLANGRIVKAKPMEPPSKFGHESFVVEILNKQSAEKINAMFKPGIEGNADGWHRAPIEMVAYKLNLMLGMDYVPPVIYRSGGVDVDYKHYDDGAFIYFVPNAKPLKKIPATNWGVSVALLLSDTRILDVLLNNSDRHHGHFLFGEHWTDGKMRPILIDHAAGFRKDAVVKMEHENAFETGAVKCVSARTYLRLRFLERHTVASAFEGLLSSREVNELMQRRDSILACLDHLVQERGYHRTVIEA